MAKNPWSDQDTETARQLLARGAKNAEFLETISRSREASRERIKYLDDPIFRERTKNRAKSLRYYGDPALILVRSSGPVAEHLLADAERRMAAPRSITSFVFGDPAPGWSALDRKQAGANA